MMDDISWDDLFMDPWEISQEIITMAGQCTEIKWWTAQKEHKETINNNG